MTNKIFVLLICFLFCVSTTANALILNPVTTQAVGMIARTTGGQAVKIASKKGLAKNIMTTAGGAYAYNYCKKNKRCQEYADDLLDMLSDDNNSNATYGDLRFQTLYSSKSIFTNPVDMCKHSLGSIYPQTIEVRYDSDSNNPNSKSGNYKEGDFVYCSGYIKTSYGYESDIEQSHMGYVVKRKTDESDKNEEMKKLLERILKEMDEQDANQIINDDKDITINIDKYCSQNSCDEIEEKFAQEIEKDESKYDIDKINKQNCEVKDDEIVSCENAKKEKDEETEEETTEDEETQEENTKQEAPKCKDSDMFKEFCEFLDWIDDEAEEPKDTKVDTEEPEESGLDEEMINIMKSCPADMQFTITMLGKSMTFKLSTMPFCLVAQKIRPYLISAGSLSALFILAGIKRD